MSNSKDKSVRFEEETIAVIDDNLVGPGEGFTSVSRFIERSVDLQSSSILQIVVDGDTLRKLIRHLNKIEGIDESKPTCRTQARWGEEQFDNPIEFSSTEETLGEINQIKRNTGLQQSVIFRCCVFKQLSEVAKKDPHLFAYDWKANQIRLRWRNIANSLVAPQTEFHETLLRTFVVTEEWTMNALENDLDKFNHFVEIYKEEFYRTDSYEQISDWCGEQVFSAVEKTIERRTDTQLEDV